MKDEEYILILYCGVNEWMEFDGTVKEAAEYVKENQRYGDYSRTGAIVVRARKLYSIHRGPVERFYNQMPVLKEAQRRGSDGL